MMIAPVNWSTTRSVQQASGDPRRSAEHEHAIFTFAKRDNSAQSEEVVASIADSQHIEDDAPQPVALCGIFATDAQQLSGVLSSRVISSPCLAYALRVSYPARHFDGLCLESVVWVLLRRLPSG